MSHPRTTIGLLVGLAVAMAAAWALGGPDGTGALLGFLLGAALTCTGLAWQAHALRVRPARAFRAQVESFLVKLGALLAFALAFRYLVVVQERVAWRAFVVAYAAAVAVLLPLGTWEIALRAGRRGTPRPATTRSAL